MCQKATIRVLPLWAALTLLLSTVSAQTSPEWRRIGASSVDLGLAGPATGPVERVWYGAGGSTLFARTASGAVLETVDFETWTPAPAGTSEASALETASAARIPEPRARIVVSPTDRATLFSLGSQLMRSEDGGRTWSDLTSWRTQSVVGSGPSSLAVSPLDASQIVLANSSGVWRTLDGGLSWAGLNLNLPNLAVRHIWNTPGRDGGARIEASGFGTLELTPGGTVWTKAAQSTAAAGEAAALATYSTRTSATATAYAVAGETVYVGTSDGRVYVSFDGGSSFRQTLAASGGAVERIYADPSAPATALAALSGTGPHVLRTTNSGTFWDSLDADLPAVPAHSVAADRATGAVYVATDRGVYYARTDLDTASLPTLKWTRLTERLPEAAARDVRLDSAGLQLYIALDGYGVFAAPAPHRWLSVRIVSSADLTVRAAAPGALLSVIGARVESARAGGLDYPVLNAGDTESQIQVPYDAVGPNVSLALRTSAGLVTRSLDVLAAAPGILVGSSGEPMLWDADTGFAIDSQNSAHLGGRIQVWATGLGKVSPNWRAGVAAPLEGAPAVTARVSAYLNGTPLTVEKATLVPGYVGFYLVEIQLPSAANSGVAELYVATSDQESNRVYFSLER